MKPIIFTCTFVCALSVPISMAATPAQFQSQAEIKSRAMGICLAVPYLEKNQEPNVGDGVSRPQNWAKDYFSIYENREMQLPDASEVKVITQPLHGTVSLYKRPWDELMSWRYIPVAGYEGKDKVEYLVNVEGQPIRLVYLIHVTKKNLDAVPSPVFCKPNNWKISLNSESENTRYEGIHGKQNQWDQTRLILHSTQNI